MRVRLTSAPILTGSEQPHHRGHALLASDGIETGGRIGRRRRSRTSRPSSPPPGAAMLRASAERKSTEEERQRAQHAMQSNGKERFFYWVMVTGLNIL